MTKTTKAKLTRHPNGYYYARLRGQRAFSLGTKSKEEAEKRLTLSRAEELDTARRAGLISAATVQRITLGTTITLDLALERWEQSLRYKGKAAGTIELYLSNTRRMLTGVAGNIANATVEHIDAFVNADDGASVATKRLRLAVAKVFFGFCSASGFILGDPSKLVAVATHELNHEQLEPKRRKVLTLEMLGSIGDLPYFWRLAILFGIHHGFRLSDTAQLTWASFETPGKLVWYPDKTRRRMETDLHPDCERMLVFFSRGRKYLFPDEQELVLDPKRRPLLSIQFSRILAARGLHGYSFHSLRHAFATRLARSGVGMQTVSEKLGHRSVKTTEIYVH
jgi:integrase